jgi:hypothetical protein
MADGVKLEFVTPAFISTIKANGTDDFLHRLVSKDTACCNRSWLVSPPRVKFIAPKSISAIRSLIKHCPGVAVALHHKMNRRRFELNPQREEPASPCGIRE